MVQGIVLLGFFLQFSMEVACIACEFHFRRVNKRCYKILTCYTKGTLGLLGENPALPAGLPAFLTPVGHLLFRVQGAPVCPGPARSLEAAALAQRTEPGPLTLRMNPTRRARDPLSWGSQGMLGVQAVLRAPKASHGGSVWGHSQLRAAFCPSVRGARGQGQASSPKPLGIPRGLRPETILRTTNCPPKPSGGPGPAPRTAAVLLA